MKKWRCKEPSTRIATTSLVDSKEVNYILTRSCTSLEESRRRRIDK